MRIFTVDNLGEVFNQVSHPLRYLIVSFIVEIANTVEVAEHALLWYPCFSFRHTPRQFEVHPLTQQLIIS